MLVVLWFIAAAAVWFWLDRRGGESTGFFSGYGEGELVYVSSPIAGQLEQLAVNRGDQIEKAAFLFELERKAESAARAEAEETLRESKARLDKATLDYSRAKESARKARHLRLKTYDTAQQNLLAAQHASGSASTRSSKRTGDCSQKCNPRQRPGSFTTRIFGPANGFPPARPSCRCFRPNI